MKLKRLDDIQWIITDCDKKLRDVAYARANFDITCKFLCSKLLNQVRETQHSIDRLIKSRNRP